MEMKSPGKEKDEKKIEQMEKKEILEWKEPHQKKIGNTVASSFKMIL
jgi:hypothetical protein